jgi:hypothetical protein
MFQELNQIYILVSLFAVLVLGHCLHEFSHWLVGIIAGSGPAPIWKRVRGHRIFVLGIEHRNLDAVSNQTIRISGFAPILWLGVSILLAVVISPSNLILVEVLILATTFFAALEMSESDVTAFIEPDEYRRRSKQGDLSNKWGWPIFIRKILSI